MSPPSRATPHNFNPPSPQGEGRATISPWKITPYFNPPSPQGEGPPPWALPPTATGFQSTLPARGGTALLRPFGYLLQFQSTLPARGGTEESARTFRKKRFQSTLPARGGTFGKIKIAKDDNRFQSTLPARGGTGTIDIQRAIQLISIHPPRKGRDMTSFTSLSVLRIFQSTLPARGGTIVFSSSGTARIFQSTLPARGGTCSCSTIAAA